MVGRGSKVESAGPCIAERESATAGKFNFRAARVDFFFLLRFHYYYPRLFRAFVYADSFLMSFKGPSEREREREANAAREGFPL